MDGFKLKMNDIFMFEPIGSELLVMHNPLPLRMLHDRWNRLVAVRNYGAIASFTGLIRQEGDMQSQDGLYFEMYEPLLVRWFGAWKEKIEELGGIICMAHSCGFVPIGSSSFSVVLLSSKRRLVLDQLDAFVEDFKHNAPIWKYDHIRGEKIFAKDRSKPIKGSGLFGEL